MWPFAKKEQVKDNTRGIDTAAWTYNGFAVHAYVRDAVMHLQLAREALRVANFEQSRSEYLKSVDRWMLVNKTENGKWSAEVDLAKKEYSAFVLRDPLYNDGLKILLPLIEQNPGILQTDIYKKCTALSKEAMTYILYFAEEKGHIKRNKKGRTYELHITSDALFKKDR